MLTTIVYQQSLQPSKLPRHYKTKMVWCKCQTKPQKRRWWRLLYMPCRPYFSTRLQYLLQSESSGSSSTNPTPNNHNIIHALIDVWLSAATANNRCFVYVYWCIKLKCTREGNTYINRHDFANSFLCTIELNRAPISCCAPGDWTDNMKINIACIFHSNRPKDTVKLYNNGQHTIKAITTIMCRFSGISNLLNE